MRQHRAILVLLATAAVAACSGMGPLSDPTSDKQGDGSSHAGDTAVVTGPSRPATPPSDVVSSFALSGVISGHEPGADTTRIVPLANAVVTLVKVGDVTGDTLRPSVTVATATTDAQGAYRLANLAPAYYRVDITAPTDSPYLNGVGGIGPARETEVKLSIALARKP
ncbi:MAG TPA: carboxypeptidase-like regulatory domain-containing protein [Gemmatimonadaceae bacterium]|nr:carboxypeptidase-like regulatory domain-containing protein [Gemmatimonadaceae bacterium]